MHIRSRPEAQVVSDTERLKWLSSVQSAFRACRFVLSNRAIPYFYLAFGLATTLTLCFLIPPMQVSDEGRHFLRAWQISEGQLLPQVNFDTHQAGGFVPSAAADFVRYRVTSEFLRNEDHLHSISDRLQALDTAAQTQAPLSERRFVAFPGSAVYSPTLYLPQAIAIRIARLFSKKIYVWFYTARMTNAVVAILLIFLALRLAAAHQLLLLIPAILPISLQQISSVSCDAEIIALSVLFVALCVRFLAFDGRLIRGALTLCLLLLVLGKLVYVPLALLLLPSYKRLGWRRAIIFCSTVTAIAVGASLAWSTLVRPVFPLIGWDTPGHNPSAQAYFVATHVVGFIGILLHTLYWGGHRILYEGIGFLRWDELPLPPWFYKVAYIFFAAVFFVLVLNWKKIDVPRLIFGALAAATTFIVIFLAAFVLWNSVGASFIGNVHGRYFIPVIAILSFIFPSRTALRHSSRALLQTLVVGFFVLSALTTVWLIKHYYFPESTLSTRNIYQSFVAEPSLSCPALLTRHSVKVWFSQLAEGRADVRGTFRVVVVNRSGAILGESDPVLAAADFPFDLLPGDSRARWRLHFWAPNQSEILTYWLITGKKACKFGPELKLQPYQEPDD